MIQRIGLNTGKPQIPNYNWGNSQFTENPQVKSAQTNYNNVSQKDIINYYQSLHGIKTAKTIAFGKSLAAAFKELNKQMITCQDLSRGIKGEVVGSRVDVSKLVSTYAKDLPNNYDAIKTNILVSGPDKKNNKIVEARTQLKKLPSGILYEMAVRQPRKEDEIVDTHLPLTQLIQIIQEPDMDEKSYVLNTKGKLMAVVEDDKTVLLTNAGKIKKIDNSEGNFEVFANQEGNKFHSFTTSIPELKPRVSMPSIGEGTDIVIGMEDGRFVPEIIYSIKSFVNKIDNEEIILDQFVASPNAKNIQLAMLAGGIGSRAEYTNASSDGIFHSIKDGAQSTKGVFTTATGLTPMETTFISLHNAGLLDCSKGKLEIGKNIKLYLNKSGVNKGNGGFSVDLYNKMEREGRKSLALFPNDSMSRLSGATRKMATLINSGDVAVAMIAKEVKSDDAKGNFGIMKLGKDNEILEFAEKPTVIPEGYEKDGKCLTNTFQFSVSKEAFKALSILEKYLPTAKGKEPRDWSKTYIPILMLLSQKDNFEEIRSEIAKIVGAKENDIPINIVKIAKSTLKNQKIVAIPTDEPWADCGTLNALYHTTMEIASGKFPLEDFERKHVLDCINTNTGLIASSPVMKKFIENKYKIDGEVMAVKKANKINPVIIDDYIRNGLITVNY